MTKDNKRRVKQRLAPIRTEDTSKELLKKYQKADEDANQQLDWSDIYQRFCKKHERSYHIKCRGCYPK